jgi:hypothetical protein
MDIYAMKLVLPHPENYISFVFEGTREYIFVLKNLIKS